MSDLLRQLSDPSLAPFLAAAAVVLGLLALALAFTLIGVDATVGQPGNIADPGGLDAEGLVLQTATQALSGATIRGLLAVPLALAAAIPATSAAGRLRRLPPRETTTAISERSFGNRVGRVVAGTTWRGSPAQVRLKDGHGNTH